MIKIFGRKLCSACQEKKAENGQIVVLTYIWSKPGWYGIPGVCCARRAMPIASGFWLVEV